jgi:hypothetical protein
MIINGGSRSNWRFFAKHLAKADGNERVEITEIRGLAADSIQEALREMDALASGTRCKNFFYHANINPREDEVLTPEQWEKAVDTLENNLGLDGHSRFIVEHEKDGRAHRHVIWSRIDTDRMTAVSDSKNYAAHERTARALEQEFGHEAVQGAHGRDGARPERGHEAWESFRGQRSGIDPKELKAELTDLWQRTDSGKAFAAALQEQGYTLCKGDRRDFCVIDGAGEAHSLARRLSGVKAAQLRERMSDIDRDGLPTVEEAAQRVTRLQPELASHTPAVIEEAVTVVHEPARAASERVEAPSPPPLPAAFTTALEKFGQAVGQAMRDNGGEPFIHDGLNWLERSIATLAEARDKAIDWAKETWQDFVGLVRSGPDADRNRDIER